jgi:hypothetical protein
MPFPTDFPKDAVATLINAKNNDTAHLALAGYEVLGFALSQYFGDVKFLAGLDFATLSKVAETADLAVKIQTRAQELKAGGAGVFLIILKLISEFGPVIAQVVAAIRDLLNPKSA